MTRTIEFNGAPLELLGSEIKIGDKVPHFKLTGNDMSDFDQSVANGKVAVIISVPSVDTPVCSTETRKFNEAVAKIPGEVILITASRDLPFAQKRWCAAEGIDKVMLGSDYKHRIFGTSFGTQIKEWDLLSRAVFVADKSGVVRYVEYVPAVSSEPNYSEAIKVATELAG